MVNFRRGALVMLLLLVAGCASNPQKEPAPQIQRISAEDLEKLLPKPDPNLTYEELVRLSREGVSPEGIIEKIRQSHSTYDLIPSQAITLNQQGVNPKVLDFIHAARDQGLRDGFADELNKRDRAHKLEVERLMRELQLRPYMGDPFFGPYPPYWRYPYYRRR